MDKHYDFIFEEYVRHHKPRYTNIINWYISDEEEITVELDDGSKERFDYVDQSVRVIFRDGVDFIRRNVGTEEGWKKEFRYNLMRTMELRGFNQFSLANAIGISQGQISNYVNGRSTPSIYVVAKMAKALECPITKLVEFDKDIV